MTRTKKNLLALLVVTFSVFQYSCDTKKAEVKRVATVEELGQMNRDFAKTLTAHDAKATAMLYDENAWLLPPNEPIVKGRENIQKYWQTFIDLGVIDGTVETIDAKNDGDLGYEIGRFNIRLRGPNGDTLIEKGKYTEVLKFDSASKKWVAIHGMWSADEPAH
jgi:ketosteroid isomerase-like protein